jgi:hypothetical protein
MKLEYSLKNFENPQISNFMKIRPVGVELFHADGWTDMTKLIVAFSNFVNVPKNEISNSFIFRTYVMYVQYTLLLDKQQKRLHFILAEAERH